MLMKSLRFLYWFDEMNHIQMICFTNVAICLPVHFHFYTVHPNIFAFSPLDQFPVETEINKSIRKYVFFSSFLSHFTYSTVFDFILSIPALLDLCTIRQTFTPIIVNNYTIVIYSYSTAIVIWKISDCFSFLVWLFGQ